MNRKDTMAIVVRLFAIAIFIYGIKTLLTVVFVLFDDNSKQGTWIIAIGGVSILMVIVAATLWFFPLSIAEKILPKRKIKVEADKWSNVDVLSYSFIILGMYFLFYTIIDAVYWLYLANAYTSLGVAIELNADQLANVYSTVVEFFVSIFLIFGSKGLSKIILKIRGRSDF